MEMTGLNPDKDTIMEAACVVTEADLSEVARIDKIVVHHPSYVLNAMDEWCKTTHGKSGLTAECLQSTLSIQEAEDRILKLLVEHTNPGEAPLGGNSVHADRMFIRRYLPRVYDHLNYRIIDVSSIRELCHRWNLSVFEKRPRKGENHRALEDILESIEELKYFKEHFLIT
ncbi:oligoribonuclease, mitochondrial [Galendromus occidentalis]|uniref:Oligoribonuclease, mitochondrial n=1 Tax=Galendromus occidentalis TaxID=34638 RepID=A0AAJ6QTN6_9ACAR|nr:oligoribonuclease, mitochondrial [Galendromus occidentalis]